MNNVRKFFLGLFYLAIGGGLGIAILFRQTPPDLIGLGIYMTGLATGLGVIVWGNVKEHQSQSKPPPKNDYGAPPLG